MDEYKIPKTRRYGNRATYVLLMQARADGIKKNMLIFVKSKEQTYDIPIADVTKREGLNKTRYLGFVFLARHILTLNIFQREMRIKPKVDNIMHKQIIICFLMGQ